MRYNKLVILAMSLCVLETTQAVAAVSSQSEAQLISALQKVTEQTAELQKQVVELRAELKQVKQQQTGKQTKTVAVASPSSIQPTASPKAVARSITGAGVSTPGLYPKDVAAVYSSNHPKPTPASSGPTAYQYELANSGVALNAAGEPILSEQQEIQQEQNADITYLMGSNVLSSQILNIHSDFDASDLLVNQSNMNEDLRFLQQRQTLQEIVGEAQLPSASRPQVFLSGKVEALGTYLDPYPNQGDSSTSLNLASAELDVLAEASPWAYGFMSMAFDGSPLNPLLVGSGNPVNNSRLFINRGFLTIGNLDRSPVYFSAGQEYVPFGDYTAFQLSNPVTKVEGRTNVRTVVLGYYKQGVYLSGYMLDGAVQTSTSNNVNEGGVNAGYKYESDDGKLRTNIGGGYISNIAEAQGYQQNGETESGTFQGFSEFFTTEQLDHQVGGLNAHVAGGIGPFNMYSEYITAARHFDGNDLYYNNSAAKPAAFHIEGDYSTKVFTRPLSLTLAYEHTWQSLALNLPQNSYIAALNMSIWKNTIETLEFRHDINYPSSDNGGGICDPLNTGVATLCPVPSNGGSQNQVLAQIGVYF